MCTSRLWHQLTLAIFEFLDQPLSTPYQVDLFNKFIRDFESKLNQLKLVDEILDTGKLAKL